MLTQEQLAARRTGIGGTDAAAILGLSRYKTPIDVYLDKILPPEMLVDEPSEPMIWGNALEDAIAGEYARRNKVQIARVNSTLRHEKLEVMLGNIDRRVLVEQPRRGLEVKTASAWLSEHWGDDGSEDVPDDYWIQCQHYMEITGWPYWDIAALIGGNEYRQYRIVRNVTMGETIRESVRMFWEQFVLPKVPPTLKGGKLAAAEAEALRQLYPGTDGSTVDLIEQSHWHEVLADVNEKLKRFEIIREEARNHLAAAMGQASVGKIGELGEYRRKLIDREGYVVEPTAYVDFRFVKAKKPAKGKAPAAAED